MANTATTTPTIVQGPTPPVVKKKPTDPSDLGASAAPASAPDTGVPSPVDVAPTSASTAPAPAPPSPIDVAPAPPASAVTTPGTIAPTSGGVTGTAGVAQIQDDAERRLGRQLTQDEIGMLASRVGAPANPDGTYSQAQLAQARDLVSRYSGNLQTPFGPLTESAPGSPTNLANSRLTELLGLNYGEVDPNSAAIQQPLGAFRAEQQRATDRARYVAAIRNQQQGIDPTSGAADAQLQSMLESQGLNEANYASSLYVNELAQQRQQLQSAIQLATQAGLQNKARELQEKLGLLDIDLRKMLGEGQLQLGARSLDQNDQQFLEQLGFNYNALQAQLNSQAISQVLAGLGGQ